MFKKRKNRKMSIEEQEHIESSSTEKPWGSCVGRVNW
jgi:hypothetical protein